MLLAEYSLQIYAESSAANDGLLFIAEHGRIRIVFPKNYFTERVASASFH